MNRLSDHSRTKPFQKNSSTAVENFLIPIFEHKLNIQNSAYRKLSNSKHFRKAFCSYFHYMLTKVFKIANNVKKLTFEED